MPTQSIHPLASVINIHQRPSDIHRCSIVIIRPTSIKNRYSVAFDIYQCSLTSTSARSKSISDRYSTTIIPHPLAIDIHRILSNINPRSIFISNYSTTVSSRNSSLIDILQRVTTHPRSISIIKFRLSSYLVKKVSFSTHHRVPLRY